MRTLKHSIVFPGRKIEIAAVLYFLPYTLVVLTFLGWWLGDYWNFLTPMFVYGAINLADHICPENPTTQTSHYQTLKKNEDGMSIYSFSPILWPITQLGFIGWCIWVIAYGDLTITESIGVILSVGIMAGAIGITFAHELIHRKKPWERLAGEALLLSVTYHHWSIEHVYGHHRMVATPKDPATARLGESFFAFMPRTVIGGLLSSFRIEATRLRRRNQLPFGPKNRIISGIFLEILIYAGLGYGFGWIGILTFMAISFIAILQLEVVNYFEHYGLQRREISPGRYERVEVRHSWDDGSRISGYFLANLQRHADHHMRPGARYNNLVLIHGAPRLPAGYATMLLVALIPPLWFYMMNPRVEKLRLSNS